MARRMIPLPPEDGKVYAMKNDEWVEVETSDVTDYALQPIRLNFTGRNYYIDIDGSQKSMNYVRFYSQNVVSGEKYILNGRANWVEPIYIIYDSVDNISRSLKGTQDDFFENLEIEIQPNETSILIQTIFDREEYFTLERVIGSKLKNGIVSYEGLDSELSKAFIPNMVTQKPDFTQYPAKLFTFSPGEEPTFISTSVTYAVARIEVQEGEVYEVKGLHSYQSVCWALYDVNNKGSRMESATGTVEYEVHDTFTVKPGEKYLYVNMYGLKYVKKQDGYTTTGKDIPLKDKLIVYNGDSIAESRNNIESLAYNGGGYAKLIADKTLSKYHNYAISGGTLCSQAEGNANYSIVDNLTSMRKDGDLYCFEGGINDYWFSRPLGTITPMSDFTGTLDTSTVSGALEYIFRYAINNFVGKPICFVIAHKIQDTFYTPNLNGDTFADYHSKIVEICNKYSIPYYDAYLHSGLNGAIAIHSENYLDAGTNGIPDGTHPNEDGYKKYYVPQLIKLFESLIG